MPKTDEEILKGKEVCGVIYGSSCLKQKDSDQQSHLKAAQWFYRENDVLEFFKEIRESEREKSVRNVFDFLKENLLEHMYGEFDEPTVDWKKIEQKYLSKKVE